jgi:hypothetical protein
VKKRRPKLRGDAAHRRHRFGKDDAYLVRFSGLCRLSGRTRTDNAKRGCLGIGRSNGQEKKEGTGKRQPASHSDPLKSFDTGQRPVASGQLPAASSQRPAYKENRPP